MRRLLLCPPDHYGIEYEINPWMDRKRKAIPEQAREQWEGLRRKLEQLGCKVELIRPQAGLPDMVFTANAGLAIGNVFILSRFRYPEREGEEPWFEDWFAKEGYDLRRLEKGLFFEGEGDALFCGEVLFCGYRFRSDIRSHEIIGKWLNTLVVSVELVESRYYHLDTCFCPLGSGVAIWFPNAFDDYGQRALRHHVPELIAVDPEEAKQFACNAVVVGQDIVLPDGCPKLCETLDKKGLRPHPLPMTEFIKAGGACKCLTLLLPQR